MKIAITADLHFQAKKLTDIRSGWEELIAHLIKNKIPYLLIGGDIFSNYNIAGREASFGTVYSAFADPLRNYIKAGGKVYAIPGNHDIAGPSQRDALVSLEELIAVVRKPEGIPGIATNEKINIQFLPWLYNNTIPHDQLIPKARPGYFNILLGHCEVSGTQVNNHYTIPVGGHFELSKEAFAGKGYDYIALGHIHKRMDYYIGAPWQLTFGEEGNRPGFVVLDIKNGKATESWIDLASVPQYYTFNTDNGSDIKIIPGREGVDYVKLKYAGEPPQLEVGDNITLEKIPTQGTVRMRTDVTTSSSVRDMVAAWHKDQDQQNTPSVDDILRVAGEYFNTSNTSPSIGSIEFIESIRLKNVGSHVDTYIDFTNLLNRHRQKFIAFSGNNGSGKTYALDSIFAGMFGFFPSKVGSVFEHIRQGCDETASICEVFRSRGKRYSALRRFNSKKRHEAILTDLESNKIVAGPKISDFDREIRALVGSEDVVVASIFSAQKGVGNIVDVEPAKRKEILWQMLNIDYLLKISEVAQQKTNQLKADLKAWNNRIEELQSKKLSQYIEAGEKEAAGLDTHLDTLRRNIMSYSKDIKDITEEGQRLSAVIAKTGATKKALSEILNEISFLNNEIAEIQEKLLSAKMCLKAEPAALERQKEINAAKSEYQSLRERYEENLKMKAQIATIHGQISVERARIAQEDNRIKNEVESLRQELETARVECEKLVTSYRSTLKIHEGNQANLNKAGCSKQPLPCPFINDAITSKDKAKEVQAQINLAKERFLNKRKDVEQKIKELSASLEQESFAKDARTRILELQKEAKRLILHVIPEDRLASLRRLVESEGEIVSQIQKIASNKEMLVDLEKRLKQRSTDADGKKAKAVEMDREINANKQASERYEALKKLWESKTKENERAQNQLTEASSSKSALAERTNQWKKELAELTGLNQRLATEALTYKVHEAVVRAFGKNGIPQLLIDSALPQIQDILNNLLNQLENRFTIRFTTQQETQGGNIKEAINIIAGDELGERDIRRFSPGEQNMLQSIIRITIALYQAERYGCRYEILCLDEIFDALDPDSARKVMQILYSLKDRFQQVIVVSHTDSLLVEIPVCLNFTNTKTHKGTTYSLVA